MARDPEVQAHQEWIGYVQPVGLVVSIPALLDASAYINRNFGPLHRQFLNALPANGDGKPIPEIYEFPKFAEAVFGWAIGDLYGAPGAPAVPDTLETPLPEYGETLRPSYALREFQPKDSEHEWILLVNELPRGTDFDRAAESDTHRWQAPPEARFERLLRETRVPAGLLVNGREIRLVYAPKGETSGYMTFKLAEMTQVAGRPILAALAMLLSSDRLYGMAENQRLPAILENSRKYQNLVSTQLAGQVLEALYELLRGFQAADDQVHGELLRDVLKRDPDHVYAGLLNTLLRLVFVLFAEDRGLLSSDPIYANYYSVSGLYDRLRADAGRYPDTMDQRYGAWAQLLALFRLIYQGGSHGGMRIPAREGYLFDPDRYLFLEGRKQHADPPSIPRVSDGVLFRVLSKLLVLDGERLSYRTLAVEQIGSVYEAIMGFELHVAEGQSIAIKPAKKHGAPATINLEELVSIAPDKRLKWLADNADAKLTGQAADALKSAKTIEDLLAVMERKIARAVTPAVVPKGAMIFQPSNERRRSGSHYTPSSLTGPIVEAALRPVLKQLGGSPTPDQILGLKVCDPAMGSAAFLVEACRQLGDALVKAWHVHNQVPAIPPDEDEFLYARRRIAQRCLYGVDKNPLAADLGKLSLWLATLAKEHPFTFLDHALRPGDSLVGFGREQIAKFYWQPSGTGERVIGEEQLEKSINRVTAYRQEILDMPEDNPYSILLKRQKLALADQALGVIRKAGDLLVAAFFLADNPRAREMLRKTHLGYFAAASHGSLPDIQKESEIVGRLHGGKLPIAPFHWEVEFPEVFTVDARGRVTGGFDVIVGNPPFAGKNTLINSHRDGYLAWLQEVHEESHGNSDMVAHFFRRAFNLLRLDGSVGLIATNTIGQGDTRSTGLRWICGHGGVIYRARKRLKWPGQAAVVVSVVHIRKGNAEPPFWLDGRDVPKITAYLFHGGGSEDPLRLDANRHKCITGVRVLGMGFTFGDAETHDSATSLESMNELIQKDPRNKERIFPFIGGEEINNSPALHHSRYIINFEDWPLKRVDLGSRWADADEEQRKAWTRGGMVPTDYPFRVASDFPDLLTLVEQKVKPERDRDNRLSRRLNWWKYGEVAPGFFEAVRSLERVMAGCQVSSNIGLVFLPSGWVLPHTVNAFIYDNYAPFSVLQSRIHEVWARFFGSSMKDDLRYTPTDCFQTFPFPCGFERSSSLEQTGHDYYELRSAVMIRRSEGLTATYNRFHDPEDDNSDNLRLRALHDAMDRAVLDAYGWADIQPNCEFLLDYEEEEDGEENGPRRRRKPWRYRWPDEVNEEVLARLLDLNRQRALEEGQSPPGAFADTNGAQEKPMKKARKRAPAASSVEMLNGKLFSAEAGSRES